MKILLLGAGGFVGRYLLADLLAAGHEVTGIVRQEKGLGDAFPKANIRSLDLDNMTDSTRWSAYLHEIDMVINAAGILRGPSMQAIHVEMPKALHVACEKAGVQHVLLISAISAREDVDSDYSQSKLAGEASLKQSSLHWTILRPSLIYGEGSYGGTSLMRGMSALPFVIPLPVDGDYLFTPIHVEDLARTVSEICGRTTGENVVLEPVGPDTISLRSLLQRYRRWLNFPEARFLSIPMPLMRFLGRVGDFFGTGPISSNSLKQMVAGNAGDSAKFENQIGFQPRSLDQALNNHPAQVQDRWHARLFFVAPALKAVLVTLWLASALLGIFFGETQTIAFLDRFDLSRELAWPIQTGTCLLDLVVAALLLFEKGTKWSTLIQLLVVGGYTLIIGIALPQLWLDPLGPLLKNLPIIMAILVYGVIGDKR
ncbi:SDR family oxidoreductase [Parasphingorhabdus sp.]|uniref:SDR family oxidoreductase n=1 Tax=Parasphingorhabdus sp. TaxID=2709688 RepID=UPI00326689DE